MGRPKACRVPDDRVEALQNDFLAEHLNHRGFCSERTMCRFRVLHTPVTSAPNDLAICTANPELSWDWYRNNKIATSRS